MNFLLDPNVSYVLLILGFLTAVLALLSPGTGLLEVGALMTLVLAGYGILNLPINVWAIAVMVLGIAPFILALFQPQKRKTRLILASALVFLIGSALLFRSQESWLPTVHPVLILFLSLITLGMVWIIAGKTLEAVASRPSFDLDLLIGMVGKASSDIHGQGTVYVNGEEWTAISKAFIPSGCPVRVLHRTGLTLEVELA